MKRILFYMPFLMAVLISCGSKEPVKEIPPTWKYYSKITSDLPSDIVNCIAIDQNGHKWIGTDKGLAQFDGTNWAIFSSSKSNFPDNYIKCIAMDESNIFWVGTKNKGLVKFNGSVMDVIDKSDGLTSNDILSVAIDPDGNKWIGTNDDTGVLKDTILMTVSGSSMNKFRLEEDFGGSVDFISKDNSGNIWIGSVNEPNIEKHHLGFEHEYHYFGDLISNYNVKSMNNDHSGNIWMGGEDFEGESGFLIKFDGANWTVYDSSYNKNLFSGVRSMAIDQSGTIWYGFSSQNSGIAKISAFYPSSNTIVDFTNSTFPISDFTPLCITIDGSGNKWIGTEQGLFEFNENGLK